jgi:hypothetical protein
MDQLARDERRWNGKTKVMSARVKPGKTLAKPVAPRIQNTFFDLAMNADKKGLSHNCRQNEERHGDRRIDAA